MIADPSKQLFSQETITSIDIKQYYSIVQEIDSHRSKFNSNTVNLNFKRIQSLADIDRLRVGNNSVSNIFQESRCNTFFRMLGLPVVSTSTDELYSPGFNPVDNRDVDKLKRKMGIASNCFATLGKAFLFREVYPQAMAGLFQQQNFRSSAFAIASIYPRPFDKQLNPNFGPNQVDTQVFKVPQRSGVLDSFTIEEQNNLLSDITTSTHILKPFMTDPRVDLTVSPSLNMICAPFMLEKKHTQVSPDNYLKRPYIERVIRHRFNKSNVLGTGAQVNQLVDSLIGYVKDNIAIADNDLVSSAFAPLKNLHQSEINIFRRFVEIIDNLLHTMLQSYVAIETIRGSINWKPIPNVNGPEFGSTLNEVSLTDPANRKSERDINEQTATIVFSSQSFDIGAQSSKGDTGAFVFSDIEDVVSDTTKKDTKDLDKRIAKLNKNRNHLGKQANDHLRIIEIITGEFSGLGLLDIMAIQATFWVLDEGVLLGLIDPEALIRMQSVSELEASATALNPTVAMDEFEKKIAEMYQLIDQLYLKLITTGIKSSS